MKVRIAGSGTVMQGIKNNNTMSSNNKVRTKEELQSLYEYLDYRLAIREAEALLTEKGFDKTVIDWEKPFILIYNPEYMGPKEGFAIPVNKPSEVLETIIEFSKQLDEAGFKLTKEEFEEETGIKITKEL